MNLKNNHILVTLVERIKKKINISKITGFKRTRVPKKRKTTPKIGVLSFIKSEENPIISPKPENGWEAWQTFNPGVILLNNKVHFLYRAIGQDGISRLGYAVSNDGFRIDERLPYPVYEHQVKEGGFNVFSYFSGGSWGGAEDPRLTRVDEEDVLYMTYTACNSELRVGLTSIKVDDFLNRKWRFKAPKFISPPSEVHKNWVIFPEKIGNKYAILHSINPEIKIEYVDSLEFDDSYYIKSNYQPSLRKRCWDGLRRGVGAPPIKTQYGWLVFYHAINTQDLSKYRAGAMLLDLNDPTKILYRLKAPILEPSEDYENNGFKAGVVYITGAVVKEGLLLIYYGAADSFVSVSYAPLDEFLSVLIQKEKPKLRRGLLK